MKTKTRHDRVLIEANETVARKLRDDPGVWYLVGVAELDRARVLSQTAHRIKAGELDDFPRTQQGTYTATSTADRSRKNKLADVELFAMYVPA